MINEKMTRMEWRILGIEGEIIYPKGCLICGSAETSPALINQTNTSIAAGSLSTQTLSFPLCQRCSNDHYKKVGRLNLLMTVLFLVGVSGCLSIGLIGEKFGGINNPIVPILILPFVVAVIASAIIMKVKNRSFPISVKMTTESFLSQKPVMLFTFKQLDTFNRVYEANKTA